MSNSERRDHASDPRGNDDRGREERERGMRDEERDRSDRKRGPTCYNCQKFGHYANQCTRPRKYGGARPSTSSDSRRSRSPRGGDWRRDPPSQLDPRVKQQISDLGRSVATIQQHFEEERIRKENRLRRKQEMEEAKRREEERRIQEAEAQARREE
ncbi:hypothetical protein CBR_g11209 [Chara braunii]|uniref:CCHC-type domain-containing protein n=1 Tax=Chara braunii TaxID=69332 RepID=A0A388KQD0_CHABU|nr:hypothetical protein CBR_g11209 [Chara braunii]|eukprot:GBG72281.1 hypothetical protein CBR_g11209 [Chara braunii]